MKLTSLLEKSNYIFMNQDKKKKHYQIYNLIINT